jgi:hypothetical protein
VTAAKTTDEISTGCKESRVTGEDQIVRGCDEEKGDGMGILRTSLSVLSRA